MVKFGPPHQANTEKVIGEDEPDANPAATLFYGGRSIPISADDGVRVRGALTRAAQEGVTSTVSLNGGLQVVQIGPGIAASLEWAASRR